MVGTTQVTTVTMEQGSGPERYRNQNEPTRLATFMDIANALAHISMGFVAVGAFFVAMAFAKSSFTIHIYLCVTGYVLLMALGILSISPHTGWARTLSYQQRKSVHLALLVSGSTLAIAGSVYRMVNYSPIFNTAHGITGTFAMVFTMLNLIGGLINYCANCSQVFRTLHKVCGILIMFLAYLALILAFTNVYRQLTSSSHANLMISFTVLAMLTTLSSACGNLFKRFF